MAFHVSRMQRSKVSTASGTSLTSFGTTTSTRPGT
jgi:hypothetical protein